MGLELVELIMELEDQFAIPIPDEDAAQLATVGAVISYVTTRVRSTRGDAGGACPTARTFYRLRSVLLAGLPLSRDQVRPASRFDSLVPRKQRARMWRLFENAGLRLPPLQLPRAAFWIMLSALLLIVAADVFWMKTGFWWCFFLPAGFAVFLLAQLFAARIPASCATLRDAAIKATIPTSMSDDEIARKVRLIISEILDVPPDKIRDESRWLDLGF